MCSSLDLYNDCLKYEEETIVSAFKRTNIREGKITFPVAGAFLSLFGESENQGRDNRCKQKPQRPVKCLVRPGERKLYTCRLFVYR